MEVDDIDIADERFRIGVEGQAQLLLDRRIQTVPLGIMQMQVEGFESTKHRETDPAHIFLRKEIAATAVKMVREGV